MCPASMDAGPSEGGFREVHSCWKACFEIGDRKGPIGNSGETPSASDNLFECGPEAPSNRLAMVQVVPVEIAGEMISQDADPGV